MLKKVKNKVYSERVYNKEYRSIKEHEIKPKKRGIIKLYIHIKVRWSCKVGGVDYTWGV